MDTRTGPSLTRLYSLRHERHGRRSAPFAYPCQTLDGTLSRIARNCNYLQMCLQVNRMSIVEQLMGWNVDGIITDYPNVVRRLAKQRGFSVAPKYPKQRVLTCLDQHIQRV